MKIFHLLWMSIFCYSQLQAFNLPRQPTKSYECDLCCQLSHESLHDQWEIASTPLTSKISNRQESYGYRQQVSAEQLHKGVVIYTLAPGGIIRIIPMQQQTMPQLILQSPDKQLLGLKEASTLLTENEALDESLFANNKQTMLQIKPELGSGTFIIKTNQPINKKTDSYLISVLDKYSHTYLQVETASTHYQYGDKPSAIISLRDNANYSIDDIKVFLVAPYQKSYPLSLTQITHNVFEASTLLKSELNDHGENWYVEASVETVYDDHIIRRSGHTAFSYAVPSASLLNVKKLSSKPLTFVATVDVATASRYALQSVLFRENLNGEVKPIETSQRAQWLEPGKQLIQFTFDNYHQLADDKLYLGYLRLIDYGQLKTVHQYNVPIKLSQLAE